MEYALELKNVGKSYGDFKIKDISFAQPKGSIMGLIGANGAGKTTTIRLILNLISRENGGIEILGMDNRESEKEIKKRIGVVFDENHFHDTLRPLDIAKILKNIFATWDDRLFTKYLEQFSLPPKKVLKEFSRGMKMKFSIAAALSHRPDYLIMDEATSGLDPVVRNEILDVFLDFIQDEERSVLLSSHITTDLEKICDYITYLNDGEVVFSKSKDEILENYFVVKCSHEDFLAFDKKEFVAVRQNRYDVEGLCDGGDPQRIRFKNAVTDRADIEEIMLFYARGERVR